MLHHTISEEEPSIEQVDETLWYTIKEPFNEDEEKLSEKLVTLMGSIEGNEIPLMRNLDKKHLSGVTTKEAFCGYLCDIQSGNFIKNLV